MSDDPRHVLGRRAEEAAASFLEASGFVSAAGRTLPPVQPASAIAAIVALAAVLPAVFNVLGSLALLRLRLPEAEGLRA